MALDEDGVAALFDANYVRICRSLTKILWQDHAAAEEVAMDAFVSLYEHRGTVEVATAEAYLWRIAINRARTRGTRSSRERVLVDLATRRGWLPGIEAGAGNDADTGDLAHVRAAIDALPYDQRVAIVLHYYCDLPDREIAEYVGAKEATVRSRLHRAREALESKLERARTRHA